MKQTEILTHATHVNGWEPAVYMSCMSQNFRLFHVSNLSVRNFRIFLLMYTGSVGDPGLFSRCQQTNGKGARLATHVMVRAPDTANVAKALSVRGCVCVGGGGVVVRVWS